MKSIKSIALFIFVLVISTKTFSQGVGIEINPPVSILHLYENNGNTGVAAGITIEQDGIGDATTQFFITGIQRWVMGIDQSDANKFKITTSTNLNSDAVMTIQTTGEVGIGTTAPSANLHILDNINNGYTTLRLENDNNQDGVQIEFDEPGGADPDFLIRYNSEATGGDNHLQFIGDNVNPVVTMDRNTNSMGIGITLGNDPVQELEVNGDIRVAADGDVEFGGADNRIRENGNDLEIQAENDLELDAADDVQIMVNGTEYVRFEGTTQRVGIGTTVPDVSLHIDETDAIIIPVGTTAQRPGTPANGMFRFNSTLNGLEFYDGAWQGIGSGGGGDFSNGGEAGGANRSLGNTDNFDLSFLTNNTSRIYIDNDGDVGIGTTTPSARLHIVDNINNGYTTLRLENDNAQDGVQIEFDEPGGADPDFVIRYNSEADGGDNHLQFIGDNADPVVTMDRNSNSMGIGITLGNDPAQELEVNGDIRLSGANRDVEFGGTDKRMFENGGDFEISNTDDDLILSTDGGGDDVIIDAEDDISIRTDGIEIIDIDGGNDRQVRIRNDASAQNDNGWATAAVDYGEFFEKLNPNEQIEIFDIVGIVNGKVTKNLDKASMILVTSTDGGLRGGNPMYDTLQGYASRDEDPNWIAAAFIGQVPVIVQGEVKEGDYIIGNGKHDGKGIAVSANDITLEQFNRIIGVALESTSGAMQFDNEFTSNYFGEEWELAVNELNGRKSLGEKVINVAVNANFGIPTGLINKMQQDNLSANKRIEELEGKVKQLDKLSSELEQLKSYIYQSAKK